MDIFDQISSETAQTPKGDIFDQISPEAPQPKQPPSEGALKSFNRYLGSAISGLGMAAAFKAAPFLTGALEAIPLIGQAESIQEFEELEERLPRLKKLFPTAPWENFEGLDKEKYMEAVEAASKSFPSPSNIIKTVEDIFGLPLTPKTPGQKATNIFGQGAAFAGGTAAQKASAGLKAAAYRSVMKAGGANDSVADLTGLILGLHKFPFTTKKGIGVPPEVQQSISDRVTIGAPPGEPPFPPGAPPRGGAPPNVPPLSPGRVTIGDPTVPMKEAVIGESPLKALVPERVMAEELQPILQQEFNKIQQEKAAKIAGQKIPEAPKPIDFKAPEPPVITKREATELEREAGKVVSNVRFPSPRAGGQAVRAEVNRESKRLYKQASDLFNEAQRTASLETEIKPKMVLELERIVEEIDNIPKPSGIQNEIREIANKVLERAGTSGGLRLIDSATLMDQIKAVNLKIDFDFVQGQPSNAFIPIKNALQEGVTENVAADSPLIGSYEKARTKYREWADIYKSNEALLWRDPKNIDLTKMINRVETPDQIIELERMMGNTRKGRKLIDALKRDLVEKQAAPYFKNPKSIDTPEYDRMIRGWRDLLSPDQTAEIDGIFRSEAEKISTYERQHAKYEEALKNHEAAVKEAKSEQKAVEKKISDMQKARQRELTAIQKEKIPYSTTEEVARDLSSVSGLKRLEAKLPKTPEGKAALEKAKDYAASRLLTQGKLSSDASVKSLTNILNDVDKRDLLEFTLGKRVTQRLANVVNNAAKITAKMDGTLGIRAGLKSARLASKFVPGLRGHVATAEGLYDLWKLFSPAVKDGVYDTISMEVIKDIIENSDMLLADI